MARGGCVAALLAILACSEPAQRLEVSFPGPVEIQEGAEVLYQGVPVGRVEAVSLHQPAPEQPAQVILRLAITDGSVAIREADSIALEGGGLLSDARVEIAASPTDSPVLRDGARVAGTPPWAQRLQRGVGEALGALRSLGEAGRAEPGAASPPPPAP
jgi:ABC-type transporter Mla subunit MlaD